jgi:spoIIIJ-associated protein
MVKYYEAKGDTIEAALENACKELGCSRDDLASYEMVQMPKSGFLGIGRQQAIVKVEYRTSPAGRAEEFLTGLLERFGTPAQLNVTENFEEKTINIQLSGDNMGAVIGHRGDTLDALQYLTSIVANREEDDRWRITVDTENYRSKREGTLEALAQKTAQKALKYKKAVALEPMNPHERRIIHAALQEVEGVTTYSTGSEPNRKVIVAPEGMQPNQAGAAPKKSGSSRRRRGNRGRKPAAKTTQSAE